MEVDGDVWNKYEYENAKSDHLFLLPGLQGDGGVLMDVDVDFRNQYEKAKLDHLGKSTVSYRMNALMQYLIFPSFSPRLKGEARVPGEVHGVVPNECAKAKLNCSILLPSP